MGDVSIVQTGKTKAQILEEIFLKVTEQVGVSVRI